MTLLRTQKNLSHYVLLLSLSKRNNTEKSPLNFFPFSQFPHFFQGGSHKADSTLDIVEKISWMRIVNSRRSSLSVDSTKVKFRTCSTLFLIQSRTKVCGSITSVAGLQGLITSLGVFLKYKLKLKK